MFHDASLRCLVKIEGKGDLRQEEVSLDIWGDTVINRDLCTGLGASSKTEQIEKLDDILRFTLSGRTQLKDIRPASCMDGCLDAMSFLVLL